MKRIKKIFSMVMAFVLFLGLLLNGSVTKTYAISQSEVTSSLSTLISQYTGTTWSRSYAGGNMSENRRSG